MRNPSSLARSERQQHQQSRQLHQQSRQHHQGGRHHYQHGRSERVSASITVSPAGESVHSSSSNLGRSRIPSSTTTHHNNVAPASSGGSGSGWEKEETSESEVEDEEEEELPPGDRVAYIHVGEGGEADLEAQLKGNKVQVD